MLSRIKHGLLVLALAFGLFANAQVTMPANYIVTKDIEYCDWGNWVGKLDLFMPKDCKGAVPLVINIHGGGWVHGQKETESGFSLFFVKGYIIANVEYRLAQQAVAPAAIMDVRAALIYLLKKHKQYHINPRYVIIMGSSAGGHLALMVGLLQNNHVFDNGSKTNVHIAAIIDKYGPADLNEWESMKKPSKASSSWLGAHMNDTSFIASVSPVSYVNHSSPPVMIIHGTADHTVPYEQSVMLKNKLEAAGVHVDFYAVEGGRHGNFLKEANEEISRRIDIFLSQMITK